MIGKGMSALKPLIHHHRHSSLQEPNGYALATGHGPHPFSQAQFREMRFDHFLLGCFYGVERQELTTVTEKAVFLLIALGLCIPVAVSGESNAVQIGLLC